MVDFAKKTPASFPAVVCFSQALPVLPVGRDPPESAQAEPPMQPTLGSPEVGPAACGLGARVRCLVSGRGMLPV